MKQGLRAGMVTSKSMEDPMPSRKELERDKEIIEALSSWGAKSISGISAYILERMYRAEAMGNMNYFIEIKKHIDYFSKKAGVDLPSIIFGSDFSVSKQVFIDFSKNCLSICNIMEGKNNEMDTTKYIEENNRYIRESLVRIQTHLLVNSWVVNQDNKNTRRRILLVGSFISPVAAVGINKVRIGRKADGGYVMLNDFSGVDGAISLGINDEDSWDVDIMNRGIAVHQYDNTIERPPTSDSRLTFFREKISSSIESGTSSIDDAVGRIGGRKLILKCDIEGSEWDVFASTSSDTLKKFSQIACEFHGFGSIADDASFAKIEMALRNINRQFRPIHIHANNSGPWMIICGVPFPSVIEVTYANRSMYEFKETQEIFPTDLDYPNAPDLPEFYLGNFKYSLADLT